MNTTRKPPQRAGIYCRLSYSPDGSLEKVERQEADCRELAARLHWPVSEAHIFPDNSRSAWQRTRKRPQWERMLAAVDAGEIDAILVYHGDRLIRQPWDLELLLNIADSKGVRLASPGGTRDLDSEDDRFILRIEAAQACRESAAISRRVKRGVKARRERGVGGFGGRRPFAYAEDRITLVPGEARLIAEAVERLLAGQSQTAVVTWLNAESTTTTGGPWQAKTLRNVVLSPRIAGLLEHEGTYHPAVWQPAVDREAWELVGALYRRNAEQNPYPGRDRRYMLTGVAECGLCASMMRCKPSGGRNRKDSRLYFCPTCRKVGRNQGLLDGYVTGRVVQLLNDPRFLAELDQEPPGAARGPGAEIAGLERRRAAARRQLAELADHPGLDPELAAESIASFDRRLGELRASLATTSRARLLRKMAGISREQWEAEPVDVRAATVKMLYRVVIKPVVKRGPGFDPQSVQVHRRSLSAPDPGADES